MDIALSAGKGVAGVGGCTTLWASASCLGSQQGQEGLEQRGLGLRTRDGEGNVKGCQGLWRRLWPLRVGHEYST